MIEIPHWFGDEEHDGFQHYKDREPIWIKNYTRLLSDEAYRRLTLQQRGVLHGLWLEYARSHRELPDDTASLTRRLGVRVSSVTLEALNHAGFITLPASTTLATRYHDASPEGEEERETEQGGSTSVIHRLPEVRLKAIDQGQDAELIDLTAEARKKTYPDRLDNRYRKRDGTATYTGCRQTRGQGGFGHVYDPLGIDYPPADWPHKPPSREEISRALQQRRESA